MSQAIQTLEQTYSQDVRTILLPSGTTNPSAFDQAVALAPGTLNSPIDSTIQNLLTESSHATTIQGELLRLLVPRQE